MGEEWNRGIYRYKIEFNTNWMLIFQHNVSKGYFKNIDDAKLSLQKEKFSILSRISNDYFVHRFNSTYEFLLEYSIDFEGEYNRWSQTYDPLFEEDNDTNPEFTATGFNPIDCKWTHKFGGLVKSTSNHSLLDGYTGSNYWVYGIGDFRGRYSPLTPGPFINETNYVNVAFINLWIRISSPFLPEYTCGNRKPRNNLLIIAELINIFVNKY